MFTSPCTSIKIESRGLFDACNAVEIASRARGRENAEPDSGELEEPLLGDASYVQHLFSEDTVDADAVMGPRGGGAAAVTGTREFEVPAMLPFELQVQLPRGYKPGQHVRLPGPQGPICVRPVMGEAGQQVRIRLAPRPEFRVQVPPGAGPGSEVKFKREDGTEVSVTVPKGVSPGGIFDVTPPALMVRVPEGAAAGDFVVFRTAVGGPGGVAPAGQHAGWCRARVPKGVGPEEYFPARLPALEQEAL